MATMTRFLCQLLLFSWALWLGGLASLFLFVQTLFARARPIAVDAAPILFNVFERYQLVCGLVAVASAGLIYLLTRSRLIIAVLILTMFAGIGAAVSATMITPRMQALRQEGLAGSEEFRQLHGRSMILYTGESALLVVAGACLPWAMQRRRRPALPPA